MNFFSNWAPTRLLGGLIGGVADTVLGVANLGVNLAVGAIGVGVSLATLPFRALNSVIHPESHQDHISPQYHERPTFTPQSFDNRFNDRQPRVMRSPEDNANITRVFQRIAEDTGEYRKEVMGYIPDAQLDWKINVNPTIRKTSVNGMP